MTVVDLQDTDGLVEAAGGWSELGGEPCSSQLPQRGPGQRRFSQDDAEQEWWAHARSHALNGYLSQAARRKAKDRPDLWKWTWVNLESFLYRIQTLKLRSHLYMTPDVCKWFFSSKTQFILSQILKLFCAYSSQLRWKSKIASCWPVKTLAKGPIIHPWKG